MKLADESMTVAELLADLSKKGIKLRRSGSELVLLGAEHALDQSFIGNLRIHKDALLRLIGSENDVWWSPPVTITPEMLPLVRMTAEEIEKVVGQVPGGAANVQDIYPLAPLQEGILFHHLLGGEKGDPYLSAFQLRFDSRTRLEAYLQALRAVIDRHDILRTAVMWEDLSEPVQVVWRKAVLPIEEVALDPAAGDVAKQLCARFNPRRRGIDLRCAPLIRAYIANDPDNGRWLLMLLLHHLIMDHTSKEVMQQELEAHLLGQASRLPEPLPFRDFVAQARLGVSQAEHEEFFRRLLGDVEEPTAPFGLIDVWGDGTAIDEARIEVDPIIARRIRECSRKLGVSAASLFHVAWAQVLAKASGREDVVFGTVLFGRMQGGAGSDRVMGLFNNTLPVRIRVGDGVEATVRGAHAQLAELIGHEHASLTLAQQCSGVPAPTPLFSALLNYKHSPSTVQPRSSDARRAWEGIEMPSWEDRTNYPVTLSVSDYGEAFLLAAQTPAAIGPKRVCEFMRTALERLVDALEMTPTKATYEIDVLPEAERQQLLIDWNRTEVPYPKDRCVHQLFEEQVERTPDATAVVFEDRQLTYRQLNERANQLARYLQELGVGPDKLVAICVERSLEMVVGLLGILKAGGAYVPLDPEYPEERLRFMLHDAGAPVLLTQRQFIGKIARGGVTVVCLDSLRVNLQVQKQAERKFNCWSAEFDIYDLYVRLHWSPKGNMRVPGWLHKSTQLVHRRIQHWRG